MASKISFHNVKNILRYLESASKGVGIYKKSEGLCANFLRTFGYTLSAYISAFQREPYQRRPDSYGLYASALSEWPYFTGSYSYPVPRSSECYARSGGIDAYLYHLDKDMWDASTPYGQMRLHFTTHIFKLAQRLAVAKYLQLLGAREIIPNPEKSVCDNAFAIAGIGVRNAFADQRNYYEAVENYHYYSGNPDYPIAKTPKLWCPVGDHQRLEFARHMGRHLYNDINQRLYTGGPISEN